MPTIIGAGAFHRPVRDGKGWFHSAMVVRQGGEDLGQPDWVAPGPSIRIVWGAVDLAIESQLLYVTQAFTSVSGRRLFGLSCIANTHCAASQNYRIKPHGQLVLVSLTHYCASTPSLSTLWSSTTL